MNTGMMPWTVRIIEKNLSVIDENHLLETCMPDEKCKYCGKEITTFHEMYTGKQICAQCIAENYRTKKNRCKIQRGLIYEKSVLRIHDPSFNKGRGEIFYKAFQRAIDRGDFR